MTLNVKFFIALKLLNLWGWTVLFSASVKVSDNYLPKCCLCLISVTVEFDDELSWLFTNRFIAPRYMKVKTMEIPESLRRIRLFSTNKIKSS